MAGLLKRISPVKIVAVLLGLVVLTILVWMAAAGPVTVLRILRYGDTNIDDFSHYAGRPLSPAGSEDLFQKAETELRVPAGALDAFGSGGELEDILAKNDSIAFLIIQGDTILIERYYQGHGRDDLSQLFSMSKSFTSALIGAAIADGYLESTSQPVTDFIPELAPAGFDRVTLHHLLTMTSGSAYRENDNPFGEHVIINYTPGLEKRILEFKMEDPPGAVYRYKSGDYAMLGLALERALEDETITEYAQRRLWKPLGMSNRGVWTVDHEGDGLEKTWCCLAASARDFAKFGRLYLNHGSWQDQQLLPEGWVTRSTSGLIPIDAWPEGYRDIGWWNYGLGWWLASEEDGDYFALGKDGQILYLHPGKDVIILRLGWSTGDLPASQWIHMFQTIIEELL